MIENISKRVIFSVLLIVFMSCQVLCAQQFDNYLTNDLDGKSGYYMSHTTKKRLKRFKRNNSIPIHGAALNAKHLNFNNNKNQLIQDWEAYSNWPNQAIWPTYAANTNNRHAGNRYDAHHIIPQSHNGPNVWWNLFPLTNGEHHQIHSNGTNCSILFPSSRGNGRNNEVYLP